MTRLPCARLLWSTTAAVLVLASAFAHAEPLRADRTATDALRWHFDHARAVVQTPGFRALEPVKRREEIRRIANGVFNWNEMSRRALGEQWGPRTAAERRTFTTAFTALAERAYIGQIEQLAGRDLPRDPVRYFGETTDGHQAFVRTAIVYPQEMPIDYLMIRRGTHWEVHDLWVDGVSATQNYAAQVRRMMGSGSFAHLVERMHDNASAAADSTALRR